MANTPIVLPPPPRRVRGFISGGACMWFVRIFTLPHTLVGIGSICFWLFLWMWFFFGTDVKGVATGTDIHHSAKSGTMFYVKYQYQAGGELKSGRSRVSETEYDRYRAHDDPGLEVDVRYFFIGPLGHAELRGGNWLWSTLGFTTLWTVFWNAIVGVFVYMIWIYPLRVRWLYKHGETAIGTVTRKRTKSGKSTTYYIAYKFQSPVTGETIEAEMRANSGREYDEAKIGRDVTVLYSPNRPKYSTLYEFGGYKVHFEDPNSAFAEFTSH